MAESVYLYMFLVGVFFAVGNVAIRGFSHVFGGLGGGDADGNAAIEADGHAEIGEVSSAGGADFGSVHGADAGGADFGHSDASFDTGADVGGADFGTVHGADFGGADAGSDISFEHGADINLDAGAHAGADIGTVHGADSVDISHFSEGANLGLGKDAGIDFNPYGAKSANDMHDISGVRAMHDGANETHDITGVRATDGAMTVHKTSQIQAGHAHSGGALNIVSFLMSYLPLRPTALICFSTVTGGAGSIFIRLGWNNPIMHVCSVATGYCLSMLLGVALPKKLRKSQNTSAAERYELIGLPARVTSTIMEGGFGRISYVVRDNTYGAPARHMEGSRVPQGAHVMIYEIKDNVFYVTELNI